MKLLIVHRAFPGQFHVLVEALRKRGDHIVALGENFRVTPKRRALANEFIGYIVSRANTPNIPDGLLDIESKSIRGYAAAEAIEPLVNKGYSPDLILTHSGWGESMFLKHFFPQIPQLHFLEYFYGASDGDMIFEDLLLDRRLSKDQHWRKQALAQVKSLALLSSLESMTWGLSPTHFQRSQFPNRIQKRCSVIHDGIDLDFAKPDSNASVRLTNGKVLKNGDPIITLINRTYEPYRGIHVFLKALIEVQKQNSYVQTILVGDDSPNLSYGANRKDGKGWLTALKDDLGEKLDWSRIHNLGRISHQQLISVFQISSAHVYFTYPFVLSWSMLEAMSCGCLLIGSRTKPVEEVIQDNYNGFLINFSDFEGLSNRLIEVLDRPMDFLSLRHSARLTIQEKYNINSCIKSRLNLVDKLAN